MELIFDLKIKTINSIYELYSNFVKTELTNIGAMNERFMIHFVRPNAQTFGIHFDKKNLQYCTQDVFKKVWLIGDSCNSYPPGHSMEIGIKDSINLINIIIKYSFPRALIPRFNIYPNTYRYVRCNESGELIWDNCEKINNYRFTGGYLKTDEDNNNIKYSFTELMQKIKIHYSTLCSTISKTDIDEYNKYQLINFLNNIINIICSEEFNLEGGKYKKGKTGKAGKTGKTGKAGKTGKTGKTRKIKR